MKLTLILEVDENTTLSTNRSEILWPYKGGEIIDNLSRSATEELVDKAMDLGFIDG